MVVGARKKKNLQTNMESSISWAVDRINTLDEHTYRYVVSALWSGLMILFGCFIIRLDKRNSSRREAWAVRPHILGIDQRYFAVFFNGVLLCGTLVHMLKKPSPS